MAAKAIKISNDGGSTWATLPGSQGSFSADGEAIEDTILGAIFSSAEVGLTNWSVSSDAIWKGYAAYMTEIKRVGTATSTTGEAFTVVSGQTYQVDDGTKEIWDRSAAVTIYDNASPVSDANIEDIDYLFGKVTFAVGYSVTGPVTADFDYFPVAALGCVQSYTLTMTADTIDETCFNTAQANSGRRIFASGLKTVALETTGVYSPSDDFKTVLADREEVIIEIDPTGTGESVARGFFKLATQSQSGAVGALEEESLTWNLYVPDETTNPEVDVPFAWNHTAGTTLNQAIRWCLDSWEQGLNTYDVQYLPSGLTGQSPLDGVEGDFVVSDISLSGDLSSMNVFAAELQGTGGFTIV